MTLSAMSSTRRVGEPWPAALFIRRIFLFLHTDQGSVPKNLSRSEDRPLQRVKSEFAAIVRDVCVCGDDGKRIPHRNACGGFPRRGMTSISSAFQRTLAQTRRLREDESAKPDRQPVRLWILGSGKSLHWDASLGGAAEGSASGHAHLHAAVVTRLAPVDLRKHQGSVDGRNEEQGYIATTKLCSPEEWCGESNYSVRCSRMRRGGVATMIGRIPVVCAGRRDRHREGR